MRRRVVQRLRNKPQAEPKPISYAMIWRELVKRIGNVLPASQKDLPALKRRLIRAGYRHPNAPRYFQGARTVSIGVFAVVVVLVAGGTAGETENMLLALAAG